MLSRDEPHLSRALIELAVTSWVVSQRELHGLEVCERNTGAWRRTLGTTLPPNATGFSVHIVARGILGRTLHDTCKVCGGCPLAPKDEDGDE